ncbi:hypothetical protein HN51_005912 [Arachis hypogaea]|uniref:sphingoid long-chain bases kinase 2, mitochondrial n=1 Tax=Arachis hypogaea TaxID=3818 RepID=UPI000DECBFD0|nr:sphingoid long-chain bases kinase 2, mitochondrial [Arachis hypogaea]QHO39738.1 Sphingoid long-chain bases kinase 2 [Arachis hypogaea]
MMMMEAFGRGMHVAAASTMVFRSELQPMMTPEPVGSSSFSSSSRQRDLVFIVNPRGCNGKTGRQWRKILPYLQSRLGKECNILESITSGPCHAIDITREAIREGADAVVAVGGDGTLHEVVNGFFWAGKPVTSQMKDSTHSTALGLIPLGTGSDFARTLHWKDDPREAIERVARGLRSRIDIGVIGGESCENHYFINVADIHLSAKAGFYASRYKSFGKLCYVLGALHAFMGHQNQDLRIKFNEGEWETWPQVTTVCIGNAKYFGGGMKITPNATPYSGNLEVVIVQNFKWHDFILKLQKLYNGTHLSLENISARSALSIELEDISGNGGIHIQSDGEHLGFLPKKISVLPGAIEMIC